MPFQYEMRYFELYDAVRSHLTRHEDTDGLRLLNGTTRLISQIMGHFFHSGLDELVAACTGVEHSRADLMAAERDIVIFRNHWQAVTEYLIGRYGRETTHENLINDFLEINLDDPNTLACFLYSIGHGAFLSRTT